MNYQGVIFDLDGVLCTTDRFHYEAWQQTAAEAKAPFDETINQRLRGRPICPLRYGKRCANCAARD